MVRHSLPHPQVMIRPVTSQRLPRAVAWYVLDRVDVDGTVQVVPAWLGTRMMRGSTRDGCARDWHRERGHRARVSHRAPR